MLFYKSQFYRSVLSQGRVDGTGGRGYFCGLEESLSQLLKNLSEVTGVCDLLQLNEEIYGVVVEETRISNGDLILNGVWKPISSVLSERFSGMFSVGVATAMHRSFLAFENFMYQLPRLLLCTSHSDENKSTLISNAYTRLNQHPDVVAFRNKWKLDIYFQVYFIDVYTIFL